jgi:hypothetical protein
MHALPGGSVSGRWAALSVFFIADRPMRVRAAVVGAAGFGILIWILSEIRIIHQFGWHR